jgi:tetratricopeptide (TPR) repeat protein/CHAT domain-containing protein
MQVAPVRRVLLAALLVTAARAVAADEPARLDAGGPGEEDALRALAERFYQSQGARDFDAAVGLWDPEAPDLPARRAGLRKLFATYERIEVHGLRVLEVAVTGETARVRVELEMDVREPVTGEPAPGYGPLRRVIEGAKVAGAWKVRREYAAEEPLAQALLAAGSDDERLETLADGPFSWVELLRALAGTAESRQNQGKHEEALAALQIAQDLAERFAEPVEQARVLSSLGSYHTLKGDTAPALESLERALPLAREAGDVELEASILVKIGTARSRRGDYGAAREAFQESYALREAAGHHAMNVGTLGNLASQAALEGDYDTAAQLQEEVLAEAESLEDASVVEIALNTLGAIEQERGSYRRAISYYERSLAKSEASGRRSLQAMALNNIGLAQRFQGNLDLARDYFTRSLRIREALGDKTGIASTLGNLGIVERMEGRIDEALDYYGRSLALREAIGDQPGAALALNSIGLAHEAANRLDQALASYRKSLEISERLGSRARVAQTLCSMAQAHRARSEHRDVLAVAGRAEAIAREIGSQESLLSALTLSGRAHRLLGEADEARRDLEEAASVLESMRNDAGSSAGEQQRFLESRVAPYEELAALAIGQGDARAGLAHAESAKARVLLDILQGGRARVTGSMTDAERERERVLRADLQSRNAQLRREQGRPAPDAARLRALESDRDRARFEHQAFETRLYAAHPELRSKRGRPTPFGEADASTVLPDENTAAAVFLVTDDRTYLFVLTREGGGTRLEVHPLPVGRQALSERVADFRERIARRDLEVRRTGRDLFELLLAPAGEQLAGRTGLVIVPDGSLWELPFQALRDARGRYLVEDHAISYAPSLTVLREMRRAARDRAPAPRTLLALGDPAQGQTAAAGPRHMNGSLGALPEAEAQLRALGRLYGPGRSALFRGAAASEERVKADAHEYRIVHFATHGMLDDRRPL